MSALIELYKDELRVARDELEVARNKVSAAYDRLKNQQTLEFEANPTLEDALIPYKDGVENSAGHQWLKRHFLTKWPRLGINANGCYNTQVMQYVIQIVVWHDATDDEIEKLALAIVETALVIKPHPERLVETPSLKDKFHHFRLFDVMTDDLSASGIITLGIDVENQKAVLFKTFYGHVTRVMENDLSKLEDLLRAMRKSYNLDGKMRRAWEYHDK